MKAAAGMLLTAVLFLSGCSVGQGDVSLMEQIQNTLNNMESYQCTATLERISNKGTNTYEIRQSYQSTGEYKLEILSPESAAGNYTVFDGKTICQYNKKLGGKVIMDVPESQMRNELFLGQFVKNYMQSEEVSIAVSNFDDSDCTVLEAVIPGGNPYLSTEKLWIDNETLKPTKFVIYDEDGTERYVVIYHDFEYNTVFEDGTFQIPE